MAEANSKLSYTVEEALAATGMSRNSFYNVMNSGELMTFKVGKRRMVSARALQQYIEAKESEAARRSLA